MGATGAAIIVVFGVMVVLDLIAYGAFQRKAFAAGYIYIPSARSVCMRGCHASSTRPKPPEFDFPLKDAPRFDPTTPEGLDLLRDWMDRTQTKPSPKVGPTPGPTPAPAPETEKKSRRCRPDPCEHPLPISWPAELPLPEDSPRRLIRTTAVDREWEGIDRGVAQRRAADAIRAARDRLIPPQSPCFPEDAEPNAPYDAHHSHPLYLGGEDAEYNLCALRADLHQRGHPRLDNQTYHLDEYLTCGICSPFLSKHPVGQTYVIVGSK